MKGKFLLIGTGASTGVPMIGCACSVCTSGLERLRPSALVTVGEKHLLIDAGPDYRQQALKYGITTLDGVLLTHAHFDHVAGLDELRVYHFNGGIKRMPLLLSQETFESIKERFNYLMEEQKDGSILSTRFQFHVLQKPVGSVTFESVPVEFFTFSQVGMRVLGFRFGTLAYVSDISEYDERIFESLDGVKILIIDALKEEKSRAHFSLSEAMGFAQKCGAEKVYFTHIAHEMDPRVVSQKLPSNMQPAYDGLELEFEL